jgi:hypothetical protein
MKGKLRPSQHYRLTLLARGPRPAKGDQEIPGLMRMGFVEPIGATSADGSREWAITSRSIKTVALPELSVTTEARRPREIHIKEFRWDPRVCIGC